ncbi:MAG TPA: DUF2127 domain-containing protein [Opitutaceae bacterium]|jgi:uncharacterized membrane protein (DUF2068 family)|nr:DUF2127 domain-containing protein [Opitutaceae bacterium]
MAENTARQNKKPKIPRGLRIIAAIKLFKGVLLLCFGLGLFQLVNRDLAEMANRLTDRFNIDPENHYVRLFLQDVVKIQPPMLRQAGLLSLVYSSILLLEGIGLWLDKRWAKYLTVVATGAFVPGEIYACVHKFNWLKLGVLILNVAILLYIIQLAWPRKKVKA